MGITPVGKCAVKVNQLQHHVGQGYPHTEIQLFKDFIDADINDYANKILSVKGLNIVSVHAPILSRSFNIEHCINVDDKKVFISTFKLAQILAENLNKQIIVVVHTELVINHVKRNNPIVISILQFISKCLIHFPNIDIAIENIIPIENREDEGLSLRGSCNFESVELTKIIREELKTDRVGTTLDTAHAMITMKFINTLIKAGLPYTRQTMEDYFIKNAEYCKVVHVAYSKGMAFKKSEHGIKFSKSDYKQYNKVISLFNKYTPNALFVIEVQESDYDNPINLEAMIKMLKNYEGKQTTVTSIANSPVSSSIKSSQSFGLKISSSFSK